jgi:hypothetical protein
LLTVDVIDSSHQCQITRVCSQQDAGTPNDGVEHLTYGVHRYKVECGVIQRQQLGLATTELANGFPDSQGSVKTCLLKHRIVPGVSQRRFAYLVDMSLGGQEVE